MTVDFILPDLGEGIHEAEIIAIKVKEGDRVEEDQPLFEVETDKAVVEIPSPYAGTIVKIHVKEGEQVKTGSVMITFDTAGGAKGAGKAAASKAEAKGGDAVSAPSKTSTAVETPRTEAHGPGHANKPSGSNGAKATHDPARPVPAAPAVRRLARELGVDLYNVAASGPSGRVMKEDVRAFAAGSLESAIGMGKGSTKTAATTTQEPPVSLKDKYGGGESGGKMEGAPMSAQPVELPDFTKYGSVERVPLRSIRRKIAQNMMTSWTHIPHVTHFDEANVTDLSHLIAKHEEQFQKDRGARLTMTAFAVKAVASALKKYPQFNSSLDEAKGEIIFKNYFNIGIAVATERGLIVPVIHNADQKSLIDIARDLKDIAEKTRSGKIELDKLQGSTFTITNIGAIGGTSMVPMINYPEAGILGMARASERPIVKNGIIQIGVILPLALSFDHRLADGAEAAYFVKQIIHLLEDPFGLIIE